ncbi:MAG: serine hydrolase domain-containing protein [Actinomycetota bacterium]
MAPPRGMHPEVTGGLDAGAVAALGARFEAVVGPDGLPGAQLALARHGEVVFERSFGVAAPDSRFVVFSATKPVVAAAVWALLGEARIGLGTRIAELIPEFAANGKHVITLEQVLLHTAGFPHAPMGLGDWDDRERRLARFAAWRCNWEPGTRFEYHATSAHWVLAELIERLTGEDFRVHLRRRILDPLGLARFELGVPPERQGDVNELVCVGVEATADELEAALGIRELPTTEVTHEALMAFNRPGVRALGVPGGGGISTAADLARFYQVLLHGDERLCPADLLADDTANVRTRPPDPLGIPADRTIGLMVATDDGWAHAHGMGRAASPRAFGHDGAGGQIAFADPATGLSVCFLTNGFERNWLKERRRTTASASLASVCATA